MEAHGGIKDNQLEERPKIVVLPNGPYLLINDNEPKILKISKTQKENLFQLYAEYHYADAEHQTTSRFAMVLMAGLDFQVKIKVLVSRQSKIREKTM
jgi:hypothetical protein